MTVKMQMHAKNCTMSVQQLTDAETHQLEGPTSSSKASKSIQIDLTHLDGNIMFPPQCIRLHLRHHNSNRATTGGQHGIGTHGNLHHGANSDFFILTN